VINMGWVAPVLMAAGTVYSAHETHEARKEQKAAIKKQEAEALAEKKRREGLMRQGMVSTVRTSPFGVDVPATTTKKTLLGQ